jgi:hypothetical protein
MKEFSMTRPIEDVRVPEKIRDTAQDLDQRLREFARNRPILSVVSAMLVGFVLARVTRGRHG